MWEYVSTKGEVYREFVLSSDRNSNTSTGSGSHIGFYSDVFYNILMRKYRLLT